MVNILLTVAFVVVCVLLILLVLAQDDGQNGMGGMFGGRGTQAFGSHSATVLSKATKVLVVLFFLLAFALAFISKAEKLPGAEQLINDSTTTTQNVTESASEVAASEAPVAE